MKLILQSIKSLFRKVEKSMPKKLTDLENDLKTLTIDGVSYDGSSDVTVDFPKELPNPKALTFAGGATGSYDGSSAKTVNSPTALKNPNALTFTGGATGSYDGSSAKTVNIPTVPTALKNPNALTFTGGATGSYDGSSAVDMSIPVGYPDVETRNNVIRALTDIKPNNEYVLSVIEALGLKHGFIEESGKLYYYKEGAKYYAGLLYIDGYYYYVNASGEVLRNGSYYITKNNGLMPSDTYEFDAQGRMVNTNKHGIYSKDGKLYYYNNGVIDVTTRLLYIDGYYYYTDANGAFKRDCRYVIGTNDAIIGGTAVSFDVHGRMTSKLYSITPVVSHCSIDNNRARYIIEGSTNVTLTPVADEGYTISSVTVMMGDSDITETAYADGVITIPEVTGDIVITATAIAAST